MIICIAVDDKMGTAFNKRRQSMDSVLRQHLLEEVKDNKLWMSAYSSKQFETPLASNIIVDDAFLDKAGENDFCFVEGLPVSEYQERIGEIILFKWNRVYPADIHFDIPLSENMWEQLSCIEFMGSSHEKITQEVWRKYEK